MNTLVGSDVARGDTRGIKQENSSKTNEISDTIIYIYVTCKKYLFVFSFVQV